jgi:uncharacterized protein
MTSRSLNLPDLLGKTASALLLGPRGTGKTRLAEAWLSTEPFRLQYNLLNTSDFRRLLENPSQLVAEVESAIPADGVLSVLIDEVQKIPELLDSCHLLIEKHKHRVRFLLTGSSARKLKGAGVNLLGGRAYLARLHPFVIAELERSNPRWLLSDALTVGTEHPELALRAYVDTYLKEEIQQEAIVRKVDKFFRFLDLAAQLNGEPINFKKFSRQIGVADKTVADYFQILIDTLLVVELPGWNRSVKKQILKSSKYYFFDCGVLNASSRELSVPLSTSSYRYGRLFETFVILEIYRENDYRRTDYAMYYYSNGHSEVDLVLARGLRSTPTGVEIKSNPMVSKEDLAGLLLFSTEYPTAPLFCITTADKRYSVALANGAQVTVLPYQDAATVILSQ